MILGLGLVLVGLPFAILAASGLSGREVIFTLWIGPALSALSLFVIGGLLISKRKASLIKNHGLRLLLLTAIFIIGIVIFDLQIRNARHLVQVQSQQFLARPTPVATVGNTDGVVGVLSVGQNMDGLAESHDIIERYARNGRIRFSATIMGEFAIVSFEIDGCEQATRNDANAWQYVADCDSLLRRINRMGWWQFFEDTIELVGYPPEFKEEDIPVEDGLSQIEHQRIAEGFLFLLHSPLANDAGSIDPNDPRVPQALRSLHPIRIDVWANSKQEKEISLNWSRKPRDRYSLSHDRAWGSPTPDTWYLSFEKTGHNIVDLLSIPEESPASSDPSQTATTPAPSRASAASTTLPSP